MDKRPPSSTLARYIRSLDAFSRMMKVPEDLRTQSTAGGTISLISLTIISLLFISELATFLTPIRTTTLSVDTGRDQTLHVHIDVDFMYVNCEVIGVDALDVGGTMRLDLSKNLLKTPIDHTGARIDGHEPTRLTRSHLVQHQAAARGTLFQQPGTNASSGSPTPSPWPAGCGSCMGAQRKQGQCCNTCEDVRKAYEDRGWLLTSLANVPQCVREGVTTLTPGKFDPAHGCNIRGHIEISKVAGRIHITPGHSFAFAGHTLHDFSALRNKRIDLSHRIHRLSFGDGYPGQASPLDGVERVAQSQHDRVGQHEYFVRVVPTTYRFAFARALKTNQYSQTYFFRHSDPNHGGQLIPGLFLNYDLSPIHVEVKESRPSFFHFLVQLCAIVGGVFTVANMMSTFMDDVVLRAMRKRQTGKLM